METLEIVIGMVFIYLLLSLLGTILQELWASITSLRGQVLLKAVAKLLEIENQAEGSNNSSSYVISEFKKQIKNSKVYQKYGDRFLWIRQLPSYLSAEQVVGIIKELVNKPDSAQEAPADRSLTFEKLQVAPEVSPLITNMKQEDLKNQLQIITRSSAVATTPGTRSVEGESSNATEDESTLKKAKAAFKQQYDEIMDRATGWYKRGVQVNLIVIGLIISFAIDADTFKIYSNLTRYPDDRQKLLQLAEDFTENNKITTYTPDSVVAVQEANDTTKPTEIRKILDSLLLTEIRNVPSPLGLGREKLEIQNPPSGVNEWLWRGQKFVGWLVTALAISLGAPFWFDILKQLIHIRNAGSRPQDQEKRRATVAIENE